MPKDTVVISFKVSADKAEELRTLLDTAVRMTNQTKAEVLEWLITARLKPELARLHAQGVRPARRIELGA